MAIVGNDDSSMVSSALTKENFGATKLSTTGGFLKSGNTTLLICTENNKVNRVIELIKEYSSKRTQIVPNTTSMDVGMYTSFPVEVSVGGATIFVLDVEQYEKI